MKKGVKELLEAANAEIVTHDVADAIRLVGDDSVLFVDVREKSEIDNLGCVPGSVHASRGMLEFYIDPASPAHMDALGSGKRLVFYCGTGGRSALAARTAVDMGCEDVAHVGGGFGAWTQAGGPVEK